jgi:hypothetical protein
MLAESVEFGVGTTVVRRVKMFRGASRRKGRCTLTDQTGVECWRNGGVSARFEVGRRGCGVLGRREGWEYVQKAQL